jgi:hypothetical protein
MTEEAPINYDLVKPETPLLSEDGGSSYMWLWFLIIIIIGLCLLGGYYYFLYFYDSLTLEDAIEKAIKHFNETTAEARKEGWNKDYETRTGDTGPYDKTENTTVLEKVLDDASVEEFTNYTPSSSSNIQNLGQLNWCFIDDPSGCNNAPLSSDECMSGDIFPTRDVCINPKIRMI